MRPPRPPRRRRRPAARQAPMAEGPPTPVLLAEGLEALAPKPGELIVDGTFGAGGYARAFLERGAEVIGFDRDPAARAFAAGFGKTPPLTLVGKRFSTMTEFVGSGRADGVALDLGVSSMQLDVPERGFSLMR